LRAAAQLKPTCVGFYIKQKEGVIPKVLKIYFFI
jgi:hypothetical protein